MNGSSYWLLMITIDGSYLFHKGQGLVTFRTGGGRIPHDLGDCPEEPGPNLSSLVPNPESRIANPYRVSLILHPESKIADPGMRCGIRDKG